MNHTMKTYPLTQSQMDIFLEMMRYPQMTEYNLGQIVPLPPHIDLDRLEQALKAIYTARQVLHIRFMMQGDEPRQMVDDTRELKVTRLILTEDQFEKFLREGRKPFDPLSDILCRFWLIELPDRKMMVYDFCHLIMDGISITLLFLKKDMPLAYEGLALPERCYDILSWADEEGETFHSSAYEKDKEYYRQHFQGCKLLSIADNASAPLGRYIQHDEYLPQQELDSWCKEHSTAPGLLFMAAFGYTLAVVDKKDYFAFSTINHGRLKRQMRQAYGLFAHIAPIRVIVSEVAMVIDFIQSFRAELAATIRHGSYPYTHFCRDMLMRPSVYFNYLGREITEDMILEGVLYPSESWDPSIVSSDLSLYVFERGGQYDLRLITSDKLYSRGELLKLAQMIKTVTQQMIAHPDATLREFSLASSLKARPECRQEPGQR